jgi:hypothetical protein
LAGAAQVELQETVNDLPRPPGVALHERQAFMERMTRFDLAYESVAQAVDSAENVVEIVRESAGELRKDFLPRRGFQPPFRERQARLILPKAFPAFHGPGGIEHGPAEFGNVRDAPRRRVAESKARRAARRRGREFEVCTEPVDVAPVNALEE